jgi:hypothetical protein
MVAFLESLNEDTPFQISTWVGSFVTVGYARHVTCIVRALEILSKTLFRCSPNSPLVPVLMIFRCIITLSLQFSAYIRYPPLG